MRSSKEKTPGYFRQSSLLSLNLIHVCYFVQVWHRVRMSQADKMKVSDREASFCLSHSSHLSVKQEQSCSFFSFWMWMLIFCIQSTLCKTVLCRLFLMHFVLPCFYPIISCFVLLFQTYICWMLCVRPMHIMHNSHDTALGLHVGWKAPG